MEKRSHNDVDTGLDLPRLMPRIEGGEHHLCINPRILSQGPAHHLKCLRELLDGILVLAWGALTYFADLQ